MADPKHVHYSEVRHSLLQDLEYTALLFSFLFATLLQMISYYRDPHGNKMMKDLTGAHSVKLQKSGFVQSGTAEQEKTASLEQRVAELEGELKRYKASKQNTITYRKSVL